LLLRLFHNATDLELKPALRIEGGRRREWHCCLALNVAGRALRRLYLALNIARRALRRLHLALLCMSANEDLCGEKSATVAGSKRERLVIYSTQRIAVKN
jgi:hypothetical protein